MPPLPADQAHSFGDAEDTEDSLTLPSDTLAALQLLKAQYPRTAQVLCAARDQAAVGLQVTCSNSYSRAITGKLSDTVPEPGI